MNLYKICCTVLSIFVVLVIVSAGIIDAVVPIEIVVYEDLLESNLLMKYELEAEEGINKKYIASLFGFISIRRINMVVLTEDYFMLGGDMFGCKIYPRHITVLGTYDVESHRGLVNPAKIAGVKSKDILTHVDDVELKNKEHFYELMRENKGEILNLSIIRDESNLVLKLVPIYGKDQESYNSGIILEDIKVGLGTITCVNPITKEFYALGHGVYNGTGDLVLVETGTLFDLQVTGITKSKEHFAGSIQGKIGNKIGEIFYNTEYGIQGNMLENFKLEDRLIVSVGLRQDVKVGKATVYCTVGDNGVFAYDADIIKVYGTNSSDRNFMFKINDKDLLSISGGIVQGMSGSPILQNGKLIGAVTHVILGTPDRGYGVYIDKLIR